MHVDRMRWIDRWCGVPICFVLTLWRRLKGDRSAADDGPSREILFVQTAEMGSLVLALPAVQRARASHPGCRVHVLVFAHLRESVTAIGLTSDDCVVAIDPSSLWTIARDTFRFVREARRRRIDTVINLEMFARFGAILTFLSGARRRVGFHPFEQRGVYCGDLLTHRVGYNPHVHTSEAFLTLAMALEAPAEELPAGKLPLPPGPPSLPGIAPDADARRRMIDRLIAARPAAAGKRIIVVNPNASGLIPIRRWPIESYARLVAALLADPENACVLTGTRAEQSDARFIAERVPSDRLVDLAGQTTIRDLLDLYNVADLLVTNDSGPAQIAALCDVDILVFFGPETPRLYQPLAQPGRCTVMYSHYACSPCVSAFNQRKTDCTNNLCLKTIGVDTVHQAAVRILSRRRAAVPVES